MNVIRVGAAALALGWALAGSLPAADPPLAPAAPLTPSAPAAQIAPGLQAAPLAGAVPGGVLHGGVVHGGVIHGDVAQGGVAYGGIHGPPVPLNLPPGVNITSVRPLTKLKPIYGGMPPGPWHGYHYYTDYGWPTALVVPPTVANQTKWGWGVAQTKVEPIYHQFGRHFPGTYDPQQVTWPFYPTPYWPSHTDQFGVYHVRGPW